MYFVKCRNNIFNVGCHSEVLLEYQKMYENTIKPFKIPDKYFLALELIQKDDFLGGKLFKNFEIKELIEIVELSDYLIFDTKIKKKLCVNLGRKLEIDQIIYDISENIMFLIIENYHSIIYDERYGNDILKSFFPKLNEENIFDYISITLLASKFPDYFVKKDPITKICRNLLLIKHFHKECINLKPIHIEALKFGNLQIVKFLESRKYYFSWDQSENSTNCVEKYYHYCIEYDNYEIFKYLSNKYKIKEEYLTDIILKSKNYKFFKHSLKVYVDKYSLLRFKYSPVFGCFKTTLLMEELLNSAIQNNIPLWDSIAICRKILMNKIIHCDIEDLEFYTNYIPPGFEKFLQIHPNLLDLSLEKIGYLIKVLKELDLQQILKKFLYNGSYKTAKFLIENGADITLVIDNDIFNKTCGIIPLRISNMETFEFYRENGIDIPWKLPDLMTRMSVTPEFLLFLVKENYITDITSLFRYLEHLKMYNHLNNLLENDIYPLTQIEYNFFIIGDDKIPIAINIIKKLTGKDLYKSITFDGALRYFKISFTFELFKFLFEYNKGIMENMDRFIRILKCTINSADYDITKIFEYLHENKFPIEKIFESKLAISEDILKSLFENNTFELIFPKYCKLSTILISRILRQCIFRKDMSLPKEIVEYFKTFPHKLIYGCREIVLKSSTTYNIMIKIAYPHRCFDISFLKSIINNVEIMITRDDLDDLILLNKFTPEFLRLIRDNIKSL